MLKEILATVAVLTAPVILNNPNGVVYALYEPQPIESLVSRDFTDTPVVKIVIEQQTQTATGTGVFVSPNKILTAAHVVKQDGPIVSMKIYRGIYEIEVDPDTIRLYNESYEQGDDSEKDLAILSVDTPSTNYYTPVHDETTKKVKILGYPSIGGPKYRGYESNGEVVQRNEKYWITNAYSKNGLSGGPIINEDEELIGIHVASWTVHDINGAQKQFACSIKFSETQLDWIKKNLK